MNITNTHAHTHIYMYICIYVQVRYVTFLLSPFGGSVPPSFRGGALTLDEVVRLAAEARRSECLGRLVVGSLRGANIGEKLRFYSFSSLIYIYIYNIY